MLAFKTTLLPPLLTLLTSTTLAFPTLGTTSALRPELKGSIIADVIRPFSFSLSQGNITVKGTLQDRVVRRDSTKTLDFYYRILYSSVSTAPVSAVTRDIFDGRFLPVADVDWRSDGLGSVAPATAFLTVLGGIVTNYAASSRIMPGQESRFVFVAANATSYKDTGAVYVGVPGTTGTTVFSTVGGCFMPVD